MFSSVSGVSSKGIAISQKHSDMPFGEESRIGIPFHFLMRDILQFDSSLQNAVRYVEPTLYCIQTDKNFLPFLGNFLCFKKDLCRSMSCPNSHFLVPGIFRRYTGLAPSGWGLEMLKRGILGSLNTPDPLQK